MDTGTTTDKTNTVVKTAFGSMLTNIKGIIREAFAMSEEDLADIMTLRALLPMVTELLKDPMILQAVKADIFDESIMDKIKSFAVAEYTIQVYKDGLK